MGNIGNRSTGSTVYLSPVAAAEALGLSRPRIHQLISEGHLRTVRRGSRRLVDCASVADLIAARRDAADARARRNIETLAALTAGGQR